MNSDLPTTLLDAARYFSDLTVCHNYMRRIKWPNGVITCPDCNSDRIGEIKTRHMLRCKDCRKQFSYKVGTIFEDSSLGLDKWFVAVWAIANCKNGISSHELGRAIGVTQKTAWFMLHRIREAMKTGTFRKLGGTVEADETFVGGKAENMHKARRAQAIRGRGTVGKTIVQGILERGGKMLAYVVPNTEGPTLRANVARNVEREATVYTDEAPAYGPLWKRYRHGMVDHSKAFVDGDIHVNGVENFWSLLKRTIKGTYIHIAPFHLGRYCDEQVFRFDNRKTDDAGRFWAALLGVVGRRLTYRRLCAIGDCGFMGIT
jgi:transposase-like protein